MFQDGQISSETWGLGNAGAITIDAGEAQLDGKFKLGWSNISSSAEFNSTGDAGSITLRITGLLEVIDGADISSVTRSQGNGGDVTIEAGTVRLSGTNEPLFTGIFSDVNRSSALYWRPTYEPTGDGGNVTLHIAGLLEIINGAAVSSATWGSGNAGDVIIRADSVRLDGYSESQASRISSASALPTYPSLLGDGGTITLYVNNLLEVLNGARISSSAFRNNAGNIVIEAGTVRLNGHQSRYFPFTGINSGSWYGAVGNAGNVTLRVHGLLDILNGAGITSSTETQGNAGIVTIEADAVRMDGQDTQITSQGYGSHAGTVTLRIADLLEVLNGAVISSSTYGPGNAGNIRIQARRLFVDGQNSSIESTADWRATGHVGNIDIHGHVGNIDIHADHIDLRHGGRFSIEARQTLPDPDTTRPDSRIAIHANRFNIDGGLVTTESTGNVSAADIHIDGGILYLTDGRITTSAEGDALTGGNIYLNPKQLILDGGFIQANAAAEGARGGEIVIDTQALIVPATSRLEVGNIEREQFTLGSQRNIIQAAAPGGEQGTISLLAPELDFGAIATQPAAPMDNPEDMLGDACDAFVTGRPSTLIERGAGGIPPELELTTGVDITPERMERILEE